MPRARSSPTDEGRYFDDLVRLSGDFDPFADRAWETLHTRFAAILAGSDARDAPLRLLDVGCGTGRSRAVYDGLVGWYGGADLSLSALAVARRREPRQHWLRADASRLPCAAGTFDVVAFSSVLHHLPEDPRPLAEAMRALRPGGLAFAFDPNLLHPAMALFRHPRSPLYTRHGVSPNERPLLPRVLRRRFAAAGFKPVFQRCLSGLPYRAVAPGPLARLLPLYNRIDRLWSALGFGRWLGAFVLTWGRRPVEAS